MIKFTPDVELFSNIFSTREDSNIIIKTYVSSLLRKREETRLNLVEQVPNVPRIICSSSRSISMTRAPGIATNCSSTHGP